MSLPRILVLIDLFPPVVGGAETHARDLVTGLRQLNMDVSVLTRRALAESPASERLDNGASVHRVAAPGGGPRLAKYAVIPAFLHELSVRAPTYDLIYLCGFRALGWPVVGRARQLGKPVILRAEVCGELSGDFIWQQPGRKPNPLLRALFAPLITLRNQRLRRADGFLAISRVVHAEFVAGGIPPARIHDIPNGIDLDRFQRLETHRREPLRAALGLPPQELIFAYSGKLNQGKGLEMLLTVWRDWVRQGRKGHLLLVGAGGGQFLSIETKLKRDVARHGLAERVTFSGYRQDVERWLQAADIFVFPSESESFGLAPLEANACGLPAIVTTAGALAETVPHQQAGLAFPPGDADALFQAMQQLADHPDQRQALAEKAFHRVQALYAFPVIARRHLDLFARWAPSGGTPS